MKFFRRFWPVGIILAVWLAFAFPYWGKGLVPFPSRYLVTFFAPWSSLYGMPVKNNAMPDVITQIYPWKRVTIDAWKRGEIPLWNPYSFSGTSHVGNYQSAIFSPVNLLFLILPEIHAWSVMILLQPLSAGLFMMLFLRSLGQSKEASTLGSLAFMFCGFITVWMAYGTLGYAVLFLPLILYGIEKQKKVLMTLAITLSFLSGHFQMSLYILLYSLAYIAYRKSWRELFFVAVGIVFALPQILPAYTSYQSAVRSSLFQKGEVIPWAYLITIFSPDFYGNPVTRNDWFGHYAEWASFIGVTPLFLAFIRPVKFFAAAAILSLFFALDTPLVDALIALKIPVLSTSSASRIVMLTSFSLAVLSGFGLDALRETWSRKTPVKLRAWFTFSFVFVIALWAAVAVFRSSIAIRNSILSTVMLGSLIIISITGFLLPKRLRFLPVIALIVLTAFDMYRFSSKWMPFDPVEYVYPQLPVITKLQALTSADHARVFGNIGNEAGSSFGLSLIEGYDAVYQKRYGKFITSVADGTIHIPERSVVRFDKHGRFAEDALQLLGVRYYMHKKSDGRLSWAYPFWEYPQYRLIWEDDNFQIFENSKSLPRVFLASSYTIATKDQEIIDALYKTLNKKESVVLEKKPGIDPKSGEGEVTITKYSNSRVVMTTKSPAPKLLFFSDVYDSGWSVTVDGRPEELLRADFDFRAVAVPSGEHTVIMTYSPWRFAL